MRRDSLKTITSLHKGQDLYLQGEFPVVVILFYSQEKRFSTRILDVASPPGDRDETLRIVGICAVVRTGLRLPVSGG